MRLHVRLLTNRADAGAPEVQFRDPFVSIFERPREPFPFTLSNSQEDSAQEEIPYTRPYWRNITQKSHIAALKREKRRLH